MLGAVQSLYHGSLLSMRVNGQCGHSQSPSIGLRQGCPLSATLFGIFIDGLQQTTAPAAGVQIRHLKLTDLVYADDICLLAGSPQDLQALIDALVGYCATLHMEISVAKTKVMVVSRSQARLPGLEAAVFTCNGLLVEQGDTLKYLGLHFHSSGGISHLITPLKAKAAGSWAVVQQRHSQLQCGNTVNLKLFLLQGILAPSLHYGCELWGMHTPRGEAQKARAALQSIYDRYLRHICGVKYATPSAMLLEESGLAPLQVFWWRRTLEFWNKIATSPVGSLFHTVLLDNLDDAFSVANGAKNFSGSIAACLQSVGQPMPFGRDGVPILQLLKPCVSIWAAPMTMPCIVPGQPLLWGLWHVHTTIGLDLLAGTGGIVSCLFLVGACSGFYSLGWALINCQSFLGVLLGVSMLPGPIGSAHIVVVWLLQMNCT